ncbi:hypothetical protein P43SY_002357 [Pythium insidiosum]|uniref:AB hydrolase-1 domain-containing protein n=1 Tax=Pythium insidiosum TaxID=114742 RepID=A0AAD5LQA7_PYTIN|nr:hypothetical protein P43SY_002357 [Pythium insidiosum]
MDAEASIMDPQQSAIYSTAQCDLQDLFRELACHGRVTSTELQQGLLPFTAGDARRDLEELIDEMKRKRTSLDEPEFVRIFWRRMYVNNVLFTTRQTRGVERQASSSASTPSNSVIDASPHNSDGPAVNIPLAHVIVSIKRRAQLKQFAEYYASRGISGADRLNADADAVHSVARATPRHVLQMQRRRQAAAAAAAHVANITALRERTSAAYDVVVYAYDSEALVMRAHTLLKSSRHFLERVRTQMRRLDVDAGDNNAKKVDSDLDESAAADGAATSIAVAKLDDIGIKNAVALGVGRGVVAVSTERRVYTWKVSGESSKSSASPDSCSPETVSEFLADEGDAFGIVGGTPLLQRSKTVAELLAWGSNVHGQLGLGSDHSVLDPHVPNPTPVHLPGSSTALDVVCGDHHTVVLTDTGGLVAFGNNWHGQLGLDPMTSESGCVFEPTRVHIHCDGPKNASFPVIVLESDGSHGMMDFWGLQMALTRNGRRSCIWDKPGLGYSDPRFIKGHENDFLTFFPPLIEALGETAPFILVGWGGGGEFIYEYATQYPRNVHSLVFLEAYPPDIEFFVLEQLKNYTRTETERQRSIQLTGRRILMAILNFIGIPLGLMPIVVPPSNVTPPALAEEIRWYMLTDKTWSNQQFYLQSSARKKLDDPTVFSASLDPRIAIHSIASVWDADQVRRNKCTSELGVKTEADCQEQIRLNELYVAAKFNLVRAHRGAQAVPSVHVNCTLDECDQAYVVFQNPQFTADAMEIIYAGTSLP